MGFINQRSHHWGSHVVKPHSDWALARSIGVSRGRDTVASLDKVDSIFSSAHPKNQPVSKQNGVFFL